MRGLITFVLFISMGVANAQVSSTDTLKALRARAKKYLDGSSSMYNSTEAFKLFSRAAAAGDERSMNALGVMYGQGIGTVKDEKQSISWFEKAGNALYPTAWYNLGLIYKNGTGVQQDFKKAYSYFSKAADAGTVLGFYSKGYMLYKGLGCEQNYKQAFQLFKEGANRNGPGSMYMLGLCYRNGYGSNVNLDSARFWLSKSAAKGYKNAEDELNAPETENLSLRKELNLTATAVGKTKGASSNKVSKKNLSQKDIIGSYIGYMIKYDWSGKNVIKKSQLALTLKSEGTSITGNWIEDGVSTPISGTLKDSLFKFDNVSYSQYDHFNKKQPHKFQFKDASIQLLSYGDSTYLVGNVQLYSLKLNEPEKPVYISLIKKIERSSIAFSNTNTAALNLEQDKKLTTGSGDLIVFPNPFSKDIHIDFKLKNKGQVRFILADMAGRELYKSKTEELEPGAYTRSISADLPAGSYVLSIIRDKEVKSVVLIKQ